MHTKHIWSTAMKSPLERPARPESGLWRKLRRRRPRSIRVSVLAIALIPCVALTIFGTISITGLVRQAIDAKRFVRFTTAQIERLTGFSRAMQNERLASGLVLGGAPHSSATLSAARGRSDESLAVMAELGPRLQELNPDISFDFAGFLANMGTNTSTVRRAVDTGQTDIAAVDKHFSSLVEATAAGYEQTAPLTFDPEVSAAYMTTAGLSRMADLHSRAMATAALIAGEGSLAPEPLRMFTYLVGAYRHQLTALGATMTDDERARLTRLTDTAQWRIATSAEDTIATQGSLSIPYAEWEAAARAVDDELFGLFSDQVKHANAVGAASADAAIQRSIWAGAAAAVLAVGAFLLAILLADRLVRRLRSLQARTMELANSTLPSLIQRLHDGQQIDIGAETPILDSGSDEIAQVAKAFGEAQRVAMGAAASEAQTRAGFNKVFLDIAHRSQAVVRRQLEVLDIAEAKQEDPEHLELLFQMDHLATRARRNAENLLILGGGNPGRRWREPIALEQIVRSAVSETEDLTRVSAIRLPQAFVLGQAVADLVHLLAELIDNAVLFSPPQTMVTIHGNFVGHGVVVEVEDQGLGIKFDDREHLNELLRNPPNFQEMALSGRRNLGLFVVGRLAKRHGLSVQLQTSAYGGVKAIVLIPAELVEFRGDDNSSDPGPQTHVVAASDTQTHAVAASDNGRHRRKRVAAAEHPALQLPPGQQDTDAPAFLADARPPQPDFGAPPPEAGGGNEAGRGRRTPLPRRHRQANLAPQLRLEDDAPPPEPSHSPQLRSAQDARRAMQSFQRGTNRARVSTAPPSRRPTDGPAI
ncbi:nitrate- and nitrite sensing domain-containing protein [Nocardia sp. NPDC051911]|uniref:nitrate- and nitrite sensing domain-containing protein n=1 Tax=Nocardia sp. NPDC051911 TaxID=3154648 RepID=UPI00343461BC